MAYPKTIPTPALWASDTRFSLEPEPGQGGPGFRLKSPGASGGTAGIGLQPE